MARNPANTSWMPPTVSRVGGGKIILDSPHPIEGCPGRLGRGPSGGWTSRQRVCECEIEGQGGLGGSWVDKLERNWVPKRGKSRES